MPLLRALFKHLTSLATALVVITNLSVWMLPLFTLALIKLIFGRFNVVARTINFLVECIYRIAAAIDSLWMLKVIGIKIEVSGELPPHPAPILIANHQTWFDIPILQYVVTYQGPILKFLIKRQLVWVPVVGWICYALNFPRLNRGGGEAAREQDYSAIQSVSNTLTKERGGLLIFAEGTRFTGVKHAAQQSPYKYLLNPRPGGLKIALASLPADTPIVDLTIDYGGGETNFWRCLHGANKHITVTIRTFAASDVDDVRDWLHKRWLEKDSLMSVTKR